MVPLPLKPDLAMIVIKKQMKARLRNQFMQFSTLFARCRLAGVLVLALFLSSANADDFSITSGMSAHWYNPERTGEGLVLEILGDETALVYWFTYDEDGNQRWMLDVGDIAGDRIVFDGLLIAHGGRFGDFNPDDVVLEVVGQAELQFHDCDHGLFTYSAFGQSESIEMSRLTQTMGAGCQPARGVAGQPVQPYAGQSGSWFDRSQDGQGYTLQWMSRDEAILIWFTFDPEGNQYWMLGQGHYQDGQIVFPALNAHRGPRFGEAFDSADLEFIEWGQLTLEIDCDTGAATWESGEPGFDAGQLHLNRLSQLNRPACPYQAPSFTDLFEIEYTEIPLVIPPDDPDEPVRNGNVTVTDIALDGTVVGFRLISGVEAEAFRWSPGDQQLKVIPELIGPSTVLVAPYSSHMIAALRREVEAVFLRTPVMWTIDDPQWRPLIDEESPSVVIEGSSEDGVWIVGRARNPANDSNLQEPWLYSEDSGQIFLPVGEMNSHTGHAVSNDGRIVVGQQRTGFTEEYATRWVDAGEPEILRDNDGIPLGWSFTCNHDCSVIAGAHHGGVVDFSHPHAREPWIRSPGGNVTYLGGLSDAVESSHIPPYLALDITRDGGLFVGRYLTVDANNVLQSAGLLWTQATGLISVADLLDELGHYDNNWEFMVAVAVSPDGRHILLNGAYENPPHRTVGRFSRGVILTLTEK